MGYIKDFYYHNLTIRKRYWPREILDPRNWKNVFQFRRQRANRGYADRDAWGGGEHIAEVAAGILRTLDGKKNFIDWDEWFRMNYPDNYGYESLAEVANDIENYLWWEEHEFDDQYDDMDHDTKWAIEIQLFSQNQNALHFVAENIGGLWW